MKQLLSLLPVILLHFQVLKGQTITVHDHRTGSDTTNPTGTTTVIDHRIPRDMSTALVRPLFEDMPVYRIQLRVTVSTNNGTTKRVYMQLSEACPKFYLAQEKDNFKEGRVITYDIIAAEIKTMRDIRFIRMGIDGGDDVCLTKVELFINNCNSPVYSPDIITGASICFGNKPDVVPGPLKTPAVTVSDVPKTYLINYTKLRGSNGWNYAATRKDMWRPATKITKEWLISLVEATIGNQMIQQGSDLKWGSHGNAVENNTLFGKAVEAAYVNNHTLKFDLDLERDLTGPNPEADVDFEIDFRCDEGVIIIEAQNVKINTDFIGDAQDFIRSKGSALIGAAIGMYIPGVGQMAGFMLKRFLAFSINLNPSTPNVSVSCKKTIVITSGDILLQ